jgi:hypothetical protein
LVVVEGKDRIMGHHSWGSMLRTVRAAVAVMVLGGIGLSIATAINNTARFLYLEPFGEMLPVNGKKQVGSLVDGGYSRTKGLQTALDLAEWLADQSKTLGRSVKPKSGPPT